MPLTFLFTDVVGSTLLLERLGDVAAAAVWRAHLDLLRRAVGRCGGREVNYTGDGLLVVFDDPATALRCGVRIQRTLARAEGDHRLAIRIGIHSGHGIPLDDHWFGTDVVIARRLCDAADGGEILASERTCLLAGAGGTPDAGPAVALSLKGLAEPVPARSVAWQPAAERERRPQPAPALVPSVAAA